MKTQIEMGASMGLSLRLDSSGKGLGGDLGGSSFKS